MHHKYKEDKNFATFDSYKSYSENQSFNSKTSDVLSSELKRAEITIQSLLHEKDSLKYALSSAVKKKEELYKVLLEYKEALERTNSRVHQLETNLSDIHSVKTEIETVKKHLLKRDEKIMSLHSRNKTLEGLLGQRDKEILIQNSSFKHESDFSYSKSNLDLALDILIKKIKPNTLYSNIFKTCVSCTTSFLNLSHQNLEEACVKLCKFACELMKQLEKHSLRDTSPPLCDPHQSTHSYYSTGNCVSFVGSNDEDYFLANDEERFEKLSKELKTAVAKSKEVLINRSFSVKIKNPLTIEANFSPIPSFKSEMGNLTRNVDVTKDTLQEIPEVGVKTAKSIARRIPKVEIVNKSGHRSAKVLPKASILKKK